MSKQKAQGTAWESTLRDAANSRHNLEAQRAENNAPSRDVEITAGARTLVLEAKACERLNVHGVLADAIKANPGEPVRVAWKRLVSKPDAKRRTAAGPAIVAVPHDEYLDELNVLAAADRLVAAIEGHDLRATEEASHLLCDAVDRLHGFEL
jgi:hypothetical protein